MALTIGQQLRAAREEKGLSIADLAHETRIHGNFIRALEADDYSNFASITYAKSFLQLYSRHLDVDATEALAVFQGSNSVNLHGSSLLSELQESIEPMISDPSPYRKVKRRGGEKPGGAPVFLGMLLGALLIAIPTFYFLGYNAEKPEDVSKEIVKKTEELKENLATVTETQGKSGEKELPVETLQKEPEVEPTQEELDAKYRKPKVVKVAPLPGPAPTVVENTTSTPDVAKPVDPGVLTDSTPIDIPVEQAPVLVAVPTEIAANSTQPDVIEPVAKPAPKKPAPRVVGPEPRAEPEKKPISRVAPATPVEIPPSRPPLRAVPIVAKPIISNEEPDATPNEDITPPEKINVKDLLPDEVEETPSRQAPRTTRSSNSPVIVEPEPDFDRGSNRFPRRPGSR